jgi:hypothetical protein
VTLRIKDWAKFQHFKDRSPPWVKLYRDILDDIEWHELDPRAAKALVLLWLIASENSGELPDIKKLAFRLRTTQADVRDIISKLSHWLEHDDIAGDIAVISAEHQADSPEKRREEGEAETQLLVETVQKTKQVAADKAARAAKAKAKAKDKDKADADELFEEFWKAYPKKVGKDDARRAFDKRSPTRTLVAAMLAAIVEARTTDQWKREKGQFIPNPATWLNQGRWKDGGVEVSDTDSTVDPDSRSAVEADGIAKGIGPWDQITEQWAVYKARVRSPAGPSLSLGSLEGLAAQRARSAATA